MQPPVRPLPNWLAAGLVFLASGAVLVLEIVGLRLVGPYIGVTLQTSSAVIGVALCAIAYGAWLGGWFADRQEPRQLLGPALVLAAIATALTLPLVRWAGELLRGGAAGSILLLTALTVFVPSSLLAAVTPLVIKLQLGDLRETGRIVGRLSSIGTLGAITATLATGFILVAALPSSAILVSLAVVLGAAGIAVSLYLRRSALEATPRTRVTAAVVGLVGAGLAVAAPNPCDVETAYHCATVVDDPGRATGRVLILNSARHSYVDLADPEHLEFEYTQWIGALLDIAAAPGQPLDTLHIGGGGFTLPRYLNATRPGGTNVVLELDGELVALDRAKLGLTDEPGLTVRVGDGRLGVAAQPTAAYDVVVGDAFGFLVVPWHLATRELVADVQRVLRPSGVYALNVIDYPPDRFIKAELATIRAVFPYVALVAPPAAVEGTQGANFVVLASSAPLPLVALSDRLRTVAPDPVRVVSGDELTAYVGDAEILTDDHAPVDQLLVGP